MICNKCDERNDSEAKFCTNCGATLSKKASREGEGSVDKYFNNKNESLMEEARRLADKEMRQGVIWFVIALIITSWTYFASESGTYYIFWGAMLYGGYRLIRGYGYKMNPESLLKKAEEEQEKNKEI